MNVRSTVGVALLALAASRAAADFPAFPICTDPADQRQPAADGRFVVWTDNRNGNLDIYAAIIPEPATVALLAAGLGALVAHRRRT